MINVVYAEINGVKDISFGIKIILRRFRIFNFYQNKCNCYVAVAVANKNALSSYFSSTVNHTVSISFSNISG